MGYKSRGNWLVGFCPKLDCVNRDCKCNDCINKSEYMSVLQGDSDGELRQGK